MARRNTGGTYRPPAQRRRERESDSVPPPPPTDYGSGIEFPNQNERIRRSHELGQVGPADQTLPTGPSPTPRVSDAEHQAAVRAAGDRLAAYTPGQPPPPPPQASPPAPSDVAVQQQLPAAQPQAIGSPAYPAPPQQHVVDPAVANQIANIEAQTRTLGTEADRIRAGVQMQDNRSALINQPMGPNGVPLPATWQQMQGAGADANQMRQMGLPVDYSGMVDAELERRGYTTDRMLREQIANDPNRADPQLAQGLMGSRDDIADAGGIAGFESMTPGQQAAALQQVRQQRMQDATTARAIAQREKAEQDRQRIEQTRNDLREARQRGITIGELRAQRDRMQQAEKQREHERTLVQSQQQPAKAETPAPAATRQAEAQTRKQMDDSLARLADDPDISTEDRGHVRNVRNRWNQGQVQIVSDFTDIDEDLGPAYRPDAFGVPRLVASDTDTMNRYWEAGYLRPGDRFWTTDEAGNFKIMLIPEK